jgi:predicted enzyme related to lactoylglutathione lyase
MENTEVVMTNQIDYFEIGSPEPEASKAFYHNLFGWQVGEPSAPAGYSDIDSGRGGLWDTTTLGGTNWAIFYVNVPDVRAAAESARQLGATIAIPPTDNGNIEFAHLIDPQGNRFGVWRPKPSS